MNSMMIIRNVIKIIATRCHILRLKCTKFDSDLQRSSASLAGFKGPYILLRE